MSLNNFEIAFKKSVSSFNTLEPALLQARLEAFSHFQKLPFPSTRLDDWKYTDLSRYSFDIFNPPLQQAQNISFENLRPILLDPNSLLLSLFVNGLPIKTMNSVLFAEKKALKPPLVFDPKINSIEALNQAFYYDGAHLILPNNCIIEEPIYIYHITESTTDPLMVSPRNFITIGENSQATIIEVYLNQGEQASFTNTVTDIKLAKNSILKHVFLQRGSSQSLQVAKVNVEQTLKSLYTGSSIILGGAVNRASFLFNLQESYATCQFNALELAQANQQVDIHLCVQHHKPFCESRIIARSVAKERARSAFTGKIIVQENAIKTKAFLENKNLLLSSDAEANSRPQLEIYNDDVQCSHGATVGHLDLDALFYLKSRGIQEEDARQLLIDGFIYPSLQQVPNLVLPYLENLIHEY